MTTSPWFNIFSLLQQNSYCHMMLYVNSHHVYLIPQGFNNSSLNIFCKNLYDLRASKFRGIYMYIFQFFFSLYILILTKSLFRFVHKVWYIGSPEFFKGDYPGILSWTHFYFRCIVFNLHTIVVYHQSRWQSCLFSLSNMTKIWRNLYAHSFE